MTEYDKMTKEELIEELKKMENLFSSAYELVSSSDAAIVGKSLDGTIVSWNRGAEKIYGYTAKEIIGQNITILSPPDRHDEVLRILEKIRQGERVKNYETVRFTKDGRQIHVSLNMSPIINETGEIIGVSSIARDVTEHKRVEEELLLAKFCIDKASVSICRAGPDAKILDANDYMCKSLGYTREELTSMSIFDIDPTFTRETWLEHRKKLQVTGTRTFESLHRRKDGTAFPVEVAANYLTFGGKGVGISFARDITEYKRAEKELQQSNTLLRAIIEAAPTAIVGLDLDGNVQTVWNPAAEKMLGLSAREAMGHPLPSVPVEKQEESRRLRERIRNGETLDGEEVRRQKSDGTPIDYSIYASPLRDAEGRITGNISVIVDITERKRMEDELRLARDELEKRVAERTKQLEATAEALRTSEERYALAVQGSNDGIWDLNLTTGEIYFSPRWKSMLGYEDDEIPNNLEEWKKRLHPDDRYRVMEARNACLEGHKPTYEIEYRLQHKDGSYRWINARGTCHRDSGGNPTRFVGSHSDITERKIIEEVLRESEKKYRTLFEESKDAIIVLDKARRVIDINDAFIELFGYTREEIFALDLEKLYCKREDRNVLWQKLEGFGFASDFEMELKRKDDERIIVHVSASAIKDDAGQISGYQGIFHDMTDRKKLEQQLLQAQKLESIGLLAGGVAHEFNNLLTGISGYGQIIEEIIPPDDELLQESVGQILRATDRAAELARSLLAFGRKQLIHPKPVHVHTIVHDTVGLIKRIIGEDIELRTSFSDKNLLVKVGEGQIEQILMNLATNARDAMPSGGHIHIATQEVVVKDGSESNYGLARPGVYVLISVSDTGTGIDKKSLERVFEPFYTTKEIGKGTGLGLSVIYGIVKQNNGSVHVESEPGEGTTVSIYLPTTNEVPIGIEKRHKAKPVFRGTETILVAEDDEMVQRFISKVLKWAGYSVITAKDGEDAVMKFKKEMDVISLVLTDVVMPKKNGKEILGEIKKLRPEIRVIFISGYSAEFIDKNVINKDSTTFITKPFLKTDLLQKVREVLDRD